MLRSVLMVMMPSMFMLVYRCFWRMVLIGVFSSWGYSMLSLIGSGILNALVSVAVLLISCSMRGMMFCGSWWSSSFACVACSAKMLVIS